jgi:shikimate kinase
MKNIILVGYMGSGKSTVGKNIAVLRDYSFVDTDEMIEEKEKRTINEIFATEGEQSFRDMETGLLRQLIANNSEKLIISTGGGMPLRKENRELLRQLGDVVYLKASPETIYERLKDDTTRPLLQCDNPKQKIVEMIAMREPIYEESASIVVNVDKLSQFEIAQEIIRKGNYDNENISY